MVVRWQEYRARVAAFSDKCRGSGEEFAEDVEGADLDPGVGVEFEVAEDVFADTAAHLSGKRQQQGFAEIRLDKPAESQFVREHLFVARPGITTINQILEVD